MNNHFFSKKEAYMTSYTLNKRLSTSTAMLKVLSVIIGLVFCTTHLTASSDNSFFQNITQDYDLTFGPVNTLSEDDNGFIWFGCDNGLYYGNTTSIEKVNLYDSSSSKSQSVKIYQIYKDNDGTQWICTENGLFRHSRITDTFEHIKLLKPNRRLLENTPIQNIFQTGEREYIVNTNKRAYIYRLYDKTIEPYNFSQIDDSDHIARIYKTDMGEIMFGTDKGAIYITPDINTPAVLLYKSNKRFISAICKDGNKYFVGYRDQGIDVIGLDGNKLYELNKKQKGKNYLDSNYIRDIIKNDNGEIWVATHYGLISLNDKQNKTWGFDQRDGLPHRSIFSLQHGRNGGIWVGTWSGGVAYFTPNIYRFETININYKSKSAKNLVSCFAEDKNGYIWIGSDEEGGLRCFDQTSNKLITHPLDNKLKKIKRIKSLTIAGDYVALGTFKNSLYLYDTKNKKQIETPIPAIADILTIASNENEILIGERRSIYRFDLKTKEFDKIFNFQGSGRIWHLFLDSSHNLWIGTDYGLYLKPKGETVVRKCFDKKDKYNLYEETIYSICEDHNNIMWLGTKGKGVFTYSMYTDSLNKAPDYNLASNADIYSIISDLDKNIWYYANNGVYNYNYQEEHTTHFGYVDGIPNEHITPNSAFLSTTGKLYFGSVNAFSIIDPSIIRNNNTSPEVYISGITINNKPFSSENIVSSNSMTIKEVKNLTLSHKQNTLAFKAVTNNYIKPSKNRIRYRLKNYDDKWLEVSTFQDIIFTKVPPGSYTLEVLGSNNDGIWSKSQYSLNIRILPSFWLRWHSILGYLIIALILAFLVIRELKGKIQLKKEITQERFKSEADKQMHEERVKFFTNISHELRTPLSLILSPINNLMTLMSGDEKAQNLLNVLERNTQRLLRLTNQTLDFRLLEVGKLEPKFAETDIVQLSTEVYRCFEQQILDKEINFKFTSNFKSLDMLIDGDMIEKVIYNLISNSLKHTNNEDHIFLSIEKKEITDEDYVGYVRSGNKFYGDAVKIVIRDTGEGINANLLPHIFERFSKGAEKNTSSSGIGLHLCTEYTELNKGNILLTSNEGIGSTFILNLPIQDPEIIEKHKNTKKEVITQTIVKDTETIKEKVDEHDRSKHKTVLLAEDNNELRSYLKNFLSTFFRVMTAKDGQQAIEILDEVKPDLIITDISMPRVSGLELLEKLKQDEATQHIPVIVLTAFTEKKFQMESILKGADSFLTKPIDDAILLAQINNVFKRLGALETKKKTDDDGPKMSTFIESVEEIIERNLQNQKFTLSDILSELNISKSTLDRKLKQQANQNPSGLIRDVRLKNAIKLMKTNKFNIDEIATYVGFNSSSYFIRSFKAKYGQTPREYREKHKE